MHEIVWQETCVHIDANVAFPPVYLVDIKASKTRAWVLLE